ncbi:hypothetical protein [Halalkalicoccus salilacus]|uniref:hypothetical protein n=1 Tax=Halalkalicoccus sp. GCM10025704 TaxID=3252662 RepID=UPI0036170826
MRPRECAVYVGATPRTRVRPTSRASRRGDEREVGVEPLAYVPYDRGLTVIR